jgi:ketosteroid isomerase-like protein
MLTNLTSALAAAVLRTALVLDSSTHAAAAPPHSIASDSSAVASVVMRYHDALAAGDSLAALALLADDAVILESGSVESRADYRSHHLPADIAFARAIRSQRGPVHVRVRGDVAWTFATSATQGDYNGRAINSAGAESMVLVRTPQGWRIASIHWSSRTRRAG